MFVTTANTLDIPGPLKDRMEIIRLSGYTEIEKTNIAKNFLIPKSYFQNAGLDNDEIKVSESSIKEIIRFYTREAGVRSLERELSAICRKVVRAIIKKPISKAVNITPNHLSNI